MDRDQAAHRVSVTVNGETFDLELIEDMGKVAKETYKAKFANLFFKTYIRILLKYAAGDIAATQAGKKGNLARLAAANAAKLALDATEGADIRMGQYFPNKAYVGGINLDPGSYPVVVAFSSGGTKEIMVDVKENEINLVDVVNLTSKIIPGTIQESVSLPQQQQSGGTTAGTAVTQQPQQQQPVQSSQNTTSSSPVSVKFSIGEVIGIHSFEEEPRSVIYFNIIEPMLSLRLLYLFENNLRLGMGVDSAFSLVKTKIRANGINLIGSGYFPVYAIMGFSNAYLHIGYELAMGALYLAPSFPIGKHFMIGIPMSLFGSNHHFSFLSMLDPPETDGNEKSSQIGISIQYVF
jgi:hypothetical protein